MQMTAYGKKRPMHRGKKKRLYGLLLFCLVFSYSGHSQTFSLSLKKAPLEKAFREIELQTPLRFVYTREMMEQSHPVTVTAANASLQKLLDLIFESQPLDFLVDDRFIKVKFKAVTLTSLPKGIDIKGRVSDERGQPLSGVNIMARLSGKGTVTDKEGLFALKQISGDDVLAVSSVGYAKRDIPVDNQQYVDVQMQVLYTSLDETIITAYGTTTRRLNTGSIAKVTADDISKQPVSNPLAALYGRVPGLAITQSTGVAGGKFKLEIRGRNSLVQGSDPLIIIDGVPFAPGNAPINRLANAIGSGGSSGMSALNTINPLDIESIEVLKDADATAIYGSRGASGVILITTKKGRPHETKCEVSLYSGWSKVTRTMNMLTTPQYIEMRREALANDRLTPNLSIAPDLVAWNTTRYTDFKKLLIGNTAHTNDVQLRISGGSGLTQFLAGGGYHRETTVFPGDMADNKISFHSNLNHTSSNKKFFTGLSVSYASDKSNMIGTDLSFYLNLPPNLSLYDSAGKLNWSEGGVSLGSLGLSNPLGSLLAKYSGQYTNLLANLQIGYKIVPGLTVKTSFGYNTLSGDEVLVNPSTSIDPARGLLPYSSFANSSLQSWITEPQAEYIKQIGKGKLNALVGGTWQEIVNKGTSISANDYASDILLSSISGAGSIKAFNSYSQYRYIAGFARLNYNLADKYVINLSGRRDGSSRFGPKNQFANFASVGATWIFVKEAMLQKALPFLSFGKIRGSYGTAGNDQIGDYKFLETWTNTPSPYQGVPGLRPTSLFNPNYGWEVNRKIETALELGFLQDKIYLTAAYFRNRCGNQLVNYTLPNQTGFPNVAENIDAIIQNSGIEIQLTSKASLGRNFSWTSSLSFAATRNKLIAFPNLEKTSYASNYVIGNSLSTRKLFRYSGVDTTLGIYKFIDVNNDGIYNLSDRTVYMNSDPKYYGGLVNTFRFKSLDIGFLFEFKKQLGLNYLFTQSQYIPGYFYFNQPEIVLGRWQKPGDVKNIQKFAATGASNAFTPAYEYLSTSDAIYSDASYIRLKNLSVSYGLPSRWLDKLHLSTGTIYMQAQNLLTITSYVGADPENQNLYVLPPLKTITAGLKFTF